MNSYQQSSSQGYKLFLIIICKNRIKSVNRTVFVGEIDINPCRCSSISSSK